MSAHAEINRLGWLSASLSTQTHKIRSLLGRIGDLGLMQAMKPGLFLKFLNLMGQVAAAKDEEVRLLSTIHAIEQKHRFRRKEGKLKHPKPANTNDQQIVDAFEKECDDEYEDYCRKRRLAMGMVEAEPECEDDNLSIYANAAPPQRPSYGWLWLIAFWVLMTSSGPSYKNQDLTAD